MKGNIMQRIEDGQEYFACGYIKVHPEYLVGYFMKRPQWLLYKNIYYDESMGDEFPNEHYKSWTQVPKYAIKKNGRKAGSLFPRNTDEGRPFLFCPKSRTIKMKYYIWDVDNAYNIQNYAKIHRPL